MIEPLFKLVDDNDNFFALPNLIALAQSNQCLAQSIATGVNVQRMSDLFEQIDFEQFGLGFQ